MSNVLDQAFDVGMLDHLRTAVASYGEAMGAGAVVDDIVLVAHELCSNAVQHGGGSGRLQLWREEGRIMCRVADFGAGMADPARRGLEPPPPHATGGRGLWIARQLADVHIDSSAHGTTVTAAVTVL
jgi:anti-sigma regulatory factor (Ser/Thr protein kinase)